MSLSKQFSVIPREVIEDKRLDYRAKGLLCVLLTRTEEWKGSITSLVEYVTPRDKDGNVISELKGEGKAAIRSSIQKLESLGYLRRIPQHDEKGMFSGYEYRLIVPPVPVATKEYATPSSE